MEEGQPPPKLKKPFLRSNSGLVTRQENAAVRRYIPKGGFIKTFEEVTGPPPKPRGTSNSKAAGLVRYTISLAVIGDILPRCPLRSDWDLGAGGWVHP